MADKNNNAPGWPGIRPRWTSSAKSGIGTAVNAASRVWFTLSHGILNEIYYPDVDQACTRDLGLMVTSGMDFFSEEKRHTKSVVRYLVQGAPAYHIENTCNQGRYRIEKEIIAHPRFDAVLQRTRFIPLKGELRDYHLYALLAPHVKKFGMGNTAWVGECNGKSALFAERDGVVLALVCSAPWLKRSAGFVGSSDGWQDVMQHKCMKWEYERAENGNVALTGEVDLQASNGSFILSVGFGSDIAQAAQHAVAAMEEEFEKSLAAYTVEWTDWQKKLLRFESTQPNKQDIYRCSAFVLRSSASKGSPGGIIASLSIPWGFAKGDNDLGGYHLVWPRDLVETAGALLAAGAHDEALKVLRYLQSTQLTDGHWPQNMWLDGSPYWNGIQMDETAFPVLLVDMACREGALTEDGARQFWPMVRKATEYLILNGPVTQEDRWEEDPGYSPFTLAVEIAGLLAAADLADRSAESVVAEYLREIADAWNSDIERWTYVSDTELSRRLGVDGYYVRIAPPEISDAASPAAGFVSIKNRPPGQSAAPATEIISPDALSLVRFGLRSPHDRRIVDTVKAIDALLKVNTPFGDCWHRYDDDGYGEHEDGSAFDGTGTGRAWPLLTGERAHFELEAGRREAAEKLKQTLESFANDGGMISEQIWDSADMPDRELFFGRPSGSAMPLVWAHAEYIKLCRSLRDGKVFDRPSQTTQRYITEKKGSRFALWRFSHKCRSIPAKKTLRVEVRSPAVIHWTPDDWKTIADIETRDSGIGLHIADLPTMDLPSGSAARFTFFWKDAKRWEGTDFEVKIEKQN
ncbi:MAG TPA: glucan 1,4-alpha-glucosidase [Bacteroidota bacterium]|nr:glucan 1,4-alpha-glucosidase [Bacteroidota bacterium]